VWLSVDPMADKYPSMSAYMYCAGNPVMLVDPDGMQLDDPPVADPPKSNDGPRVPTPAELHYTMQQSFQELVDRVSQPDFAQQNNITRSQEGLLNLANIMLDIGIQEDIEKVPQDRRPLVGVTVEAYFCFENPDNPTEPDWNNASRFTSSRPYPDPETAPMAINPGVDRRPRAPHILIENDSKLFFYIVVVVIPFT